MEEDSIKEILLEEEGMEDILYEDKSDDGDGELDLTPLGENIAKLIKKVADRSLEEGKRVGRKETLDEIFQACYQEKSKTRELVENMRRGSNIPVGFNSDGRYVGY